MADGILLVNGSRTLHGVGDGGVVLQPVASPSSTAHLRLKSLDAGLLSTGNTANMEMYIFPGLLPRAQDGVAFSLWNNIWKAPHIP